MFIIITGTTSSGKSTFQDYLVKVKGFIKIRLLHKPKTAVAVRLNGTTEHANSQTSLSEKLQNIDITSEQNLSSNQVNLISSTTAPSPLDTTGTGLKETDHLCHSIVELLQYITQNWKTDFVTTDVVERDVLRIISKRPYVLLVFIDAPILLRFKRYADREGRSDLESFVKSHDSQFNDDTNIIYDFHRNENSTPALRIFNEFSTVTDFHDHIESLDLRNQDRLRPGWDTYFMTLASLASMRSNCMKRRVGAILVRDNRIVSTGYNGTPRGVLNCNEGGCPRCNESVSPVSDEECLCLHAEENALLEAGRERVGMNAVLYCNTCPCLKCTIKIVQTGVKEVVYNLSYKMDSASARVFLEAGVKLRQHCPP